MTNPQGAPPRSLVRSTVAIVVLSIVSTLLGLLRVDQYNDPDALLPRLFAQDAVILLVAVPVMATGLWYTIRGSLRGRVIWLGALAYMAYMWASIAGQVAFNQFFIGYVTLFSLSLFTLIGGVVNTSPRVVSQGVSGTLSRTLYSGFLAFVAVGLASLWLSELIPATLSGVAPLAIQKLGPQAAHTYVLDLGVVVPALAITAILLWREQRWGYVFTGVLLVMAALLAPTLTAITVIDVLGDYVTVSIPLVVGTILPPTVSAGFAIKYLLAIDGPPYTNRQSDEQGTNV